MAELKNADRAVDPVLADASTDGVVPLALAPRVPSATELLLQELAESEHHLRHPVAFAELCAVAGFKLDRKPHRWEVEPA